MADNVQWIRLKVGMFDGNSFKKIKRAKIGGVAFRDKLTAVWFELLDLAGKSNANGCLVDNNEIPYRTFEDISIMLDREEKEIELCMEFFLAEKMVEIVDDIFCLTNFMQYQNQDGLDKIREQKRISQAKWRERKKQGLLSKGVDSTVDSTSILPSISISTSTSMIFEEYGFSDKLKDSIIKWLDYKKEKRQSYKDTGLKTLLTKLQKQAKEKGEQFVIDSIEHSISNNWSGIYEPQVKTSNGQPVEIPKYSTTSADDAMARAMQRSYDDE